MAVASKGCSYGPYGPNYQQTWTSSYVSGTMPVAYSSVSTRSVSSIYQTNAGQRFQQPGLLTHRVPVPTDSTICKPGIVTYNGPEMTVVPCSYSMPHPPNTREEKHEERLEMIHEGKPITLLIDSKTSDGVTAFWFPFGFNQNVINGRFREDGSLTSNACTLIAVLGSCNIELGGHSIKKFTKPSELRESIMLFMTTISNGNTLHHGLVTSGMLVNRLNVTIPEACKTVQPEMTVLIEMFYTQMDMRGHEFGFVVFKEITRAMKIFYKTFPIPHTPKNMFLIIIVDQRSMVFVNQLDTGLITFFDSHCHVPYGAVMAQSKATDLGDLCRWYQKVCFDLCPEKPYRFELSCLVSKDYAEAAKLGYNIGGLHDVEGSDGSHLYEEEEWNPLKTASRCCCQCRRQRRHSK